MRILWITPKWTLPVTDGARVATDSLIRSIIRMGALIDYWALSNQEDRPDPAFMVNHWGVQEATYSQRSIPLDSLGKKIYYLKKLITSPTRPLTFSSFSDKKFVLYLKEKIQKQKYDFIILDGLHLGVLVEKLPADILNKVIYRAHNIEADLWKKSFETTKNPILKSLFWSQFKLVQNFETALLQKVRGVAAISQEDYEIINKINPTLTLAPLGLKFKEVSPPKSSHQTELIFVGRLDWPPNKDGLKWLLDEVWPEVIKIRDDVRLTIYGSGDRQWLTPYRNLPQIEIKGFVQSIADAYKDAHFTLVPVFYGSGTRIKVVESFSLGRRLVSTEMGVQGANLAPDDYIRAESREEWIKTISELHFDSTDFDKLMTSRKRIAEEFDEALIGERFYHWLKSL